MIVDLKKKAFEKYPKITERFFTYRYLVFIFLNLIVAFVLLFFVDARSRATIFAAEIAFMIAFVAYPWQKRKDRELAEAAEFRGVVSEFFADVDKALHFDRDSKSNEKSDHGIDIMKSRLNIIALYVGASEFKYFENLYLSCCIVYNKIENLSVESQDICDETIDDIVEEVGLIASLDEAINAARRELFHHNADEIALSITFNTSTNSQKEYDER